MASTALFPPQIEAHRKLVDQALEKFCEFDTDCPEHLAEAIRYCLLAPGKRIRPLLTLAAAEACECEVSAAIPVACACLLYTSPSPRDATLSRMPSSA